MLSLLAAGVCLVAHAQTEVDRLVSTLLPTAREARLAVVNHPTLAAMEIEYPLREALGKVKLAIDAGEDMASVKAGLAPLEGLVGPVKEVPLIEIHLQLAQLAEREQKQEERNYHTAYALALFEAMVEGADGRTEATAYKVVMISEEYDWFGFAQKSWARKGRVARDIGGRMFDIWTAVSPSGQERKVYFDAGAMGESLNRVFSARMAAGDGK